jgi:hypothetical protein
MELTLNLEIPPLPEPIKYGDKILLIGSCFTEHISERLSQFKFTTLTDPHGIIFNPLSVANSLNSYVDDKLYKKEDLFPLNELWNSWDHHTSFSDINADTALEKINNSQRSASEYLRNADWVMITLGSAFQYYLKDSGRAVANNHRAPSQLFEKKLLPIDEIISVLTQSLENIRSVNTKAKFLFTISPVRHIRDGVVENNRSKARLIEAVHHICQNTKLSFYFPAYELLIDILRDYRFYDIDFVHPNYLATQLVWERFADACIDPKERRLMEQIKEIVTSRSHRPRFPGTEAHRNFMLANRKKLEALQDQYPFLDLKEELEYFSAL